MKEYWSTEPALSSSSSQKHVKSFLPSAKHLGFSGSSFSNRDTEGMKATDKFKRNQKLFTFACHHHLKYIFKWYVITYIKGKSEVYRTSQVRLLIDSTFCDSVTTGKMLSYPFSRNLVCPGRRQVFAWRRIWCKEPTIGWGGRISSFCLLCGHKDFGLLMSACITGEQPASNSSTAAVVGGGLLFGLDTRESATRLRVCLWAIRCEEAELFTFSWSQRRTGGAEGVLQNFLLSVWWAGITRSLMFTICFCCCGEWGRGPWTCDVRKSAQAEIDS